MHKSSPPPSNAGAPNGPGRTAAFNRWFRYPAGFARDLTTPLVAPLKPLKSATVLDPFAGVATLAPWFARNGHTFVGVEAHPLVAEIGDLKAGTWPQPADLAAAAGALVTERTDEPLDGEHDVVRQCFDEETLSTLVSLRESIRAREGLLGRWLLVALLATLRDVSTSHVGWPYQRPSVDAVPKCNDAESRFLQRVRWMAEDIRSDPPHRTDGEVLVGDAREEGVWQELRRRRGLADVCITSPPYLNNYDYADATRLELFFLGRADSWSSMCRYARDGMVVASTQQTSMDRAEGCRHQLTQTPIATEVDGILDDLAEAFGERKRPKEYDRLVVEYFADMASILRNTRAHLKEDGVLTMAVADSALYGVHVDTPRLLGDLATGHGFKVEGLDKHRERGRRWAQNSHRSDVALGEYVLTLRTSS